MKRVTVRTTPPYTVEIDVGALTRVARAADAYASSAILTDSNVGPLYLHALEGLNHAPHLTIPAGETSKRFSDLERVLDFMISTGLDRRSCLIALGGGVVGDLGGFAASLYMRGIAVIQAPTSLLAQVDSSVGGKTGVNLAGGKNLAGTFHQPAAVLADTSTLRTLSDDEYRSGLGEVLKSALIEGERALLLLERDAAAIASRDPEVLEHVVELCVRTKAAIVERDPTEKGERKKLNLGHTFAHAIEHAAGYGRVPHGVAVGVGSMLALHTSRALGLSTEPELAERCARWLARMGMPTDLASLERASGTKLAPSALLAGMRHDKKGRAGEARLVLPRAAGDIEVDVAPEAGVLERILAG